MNMRIFAIVFLFAPLCIKAQQNTIKENGISYVPLVQSIHRFENGLVFNNEKDIIKWFVEHRQANDFFELNHGLK